MDKDDQRKAPRQDQTVDRSANATMSDGSSGLDVLEEHPMAHNLRSQ
jgi:hypothetical protein